MGGAAGHMNHPFDVDWVNSGEDLIDFFLDAAEFLQTNPGSIKWDGVNTSFKLITDENGKKDFRIDRGNQEPMSVIGMTAADAYEKWPKGHGMPPAINDLLTIFNAALPTIEPELKALGMWEDSTKLFNTEYIGEGGSNVIQYGKNILAIHGINQFYEKKAQPHRIRKGIGMDRPGLERPLDPETGKPVKGVSVEINYDRKALESLIEKVRPIAAKYDFSILGDTPAENVAPIDFESVLDTSFPIKLTEDNVPSHSIREWLRDAVNPRDTRIITNEGKDIGALSKQVYIAVLNNVPLVDWLQTQEDVEMAVNGAVFYHATKELGDAVKSSVRVSEGVSGMLGWDPKFDNAANHEGIILRDPKFGSKPVKITGKFILEGLASTHGDPSKQAMAQETQPTDIQVEKSKLALLAGGFKPPHKGHLEMVKFYNQQVGPNGKVIVLLGSGGKEPRTINGRPITAQDSMDIWDIFLRNEPTIPWPSNKIEFQNVEGAGPIAPIIDYVREQAPEDQIILLGAGEKDEDRWPNIMANPRNNPRGLEIETTPAPNMVDDNGNPLSARNMRAAVENGDLETFKSYIPDSSQQFAEKIFVTLGNGTIEEPQEEPQEQLQEDNPLPLGIFLGLIKEELNKKLLQEYDPGPMPSAEGYDKPERGLLDSLWSALPHSVKSYGETWSPWGASNAAAGKTPGGELQMSPEHRGKIHPTGPLGSVKIGPKDKLGKMQDPGEYERETDAAKEDALLAVADALMLGGEMSVLKRLAAAKAAAAAGTRASKAVKDTTKAVGEIAKPRTIAVVPGAYKPPHRGHMDMIKHYAHKADEVVILVSPNPRGGVTAQQSAKIWQRYIDSSGIPNVKIEVSQGSPVKSAIEFGNRPEVAGSDIILGASTKPDAKGMADIIRFNRDMQQYSPNVNILDPMEHAYTPQRAMGASGFRSALESGQPIERFIPDEAVEHIPWIRDALKEGSERTLSSDMFKQLVEQALYEQADTGREDDEEEYEGGEGEIPVGGEGAEEPKDTTQRPALVNLNTLEKVLNPLETGLQFVVDKAAKYIHNNQHPKSVSDELDKLIPGRVPKERRDPGRPFQSKLAKKEIEDARTSLIHSYMPGGANFEQFVGDQGYLARKFPELSQKERVKKYETEILPTVYSAAKTPFYRSGHKIATKFGNPDLGAAAYYQHHGDHGPHIMMGPAHEDPRTFRFRSTSRHELGHAIKAALVDKLGSDYEKDIKGIMKRDLPDVYMGKGYPKGVKHHQAWGELHTDIINSRSALGRPFKASDIDFMDEYKPVYGKGRKADAEYIPSDLWHFIEDIRSKKPNMTSEEIANTLNQISLADPTKDPRREPQMVAESALSSDQFLQLINQTLHEVADSSNLYGMTGHGYDYNKHKTPQWNDQAAEDAIYDNDDHEGRIKHVAEGDTEELEEMSSMAGGSVEGSSGGAWGKDFTSENKEEARKSHTLEEDEELVENIVNYLNNGVGVL